MRVCTVFPVDEQALNSDLRKATQTFGTMEESEDIYSEVDSEDFVQDMRNYGVSQALPLDDEGIDEDAAAYLRAVREEASRMPHVTASVRRYGEPEPPVHQDPHATSTDQPIPMMDWIHSVVNGFVEARQQVHFQVQHGQPRTLDETQVPCDQPVPSASDRRAWQRSIQDTSFQPYADTLSKMDNNLAASCLCSLAEELSNRCAPAPASTQHSQHTSAAGSASVPGEPLPPHQALWLYGLMVRLEQPVTPEVAAALRRVVTVAEACLQRCKPAEACDASQPSNRSSADCARVSEDDDMQEDAVAAASAAEIALQMEGTMSPVPLQPIRDAASTAECAGTSHAEGGLRGGGGQMDDASVDAVPEAEASLSCSAAVASRGGGSPGDASADGLGDRMHCDGNGVVGGSGCGGEEEGAVQDGGGAAQEVARCDTLRVLAGGFFGQDRALGPLVHGYLRSMEASFT